MQEEKKEIMLNLRIEKDLAEKFKKICEKNGLKIKFILTQAIKDFIEKNK